MKQLGTEYTKINNILSLFEKHPNKYMRLTHALSLLSIIQMTKYVIVTVVIVTVVIVTVVIVTVVMVSFDRNSMDEFIVITIGTSNYNLITIASY